MRTINFLFLLMSLIAFFSLRPTRLKKITPKSVESFSCKVQQVLKKNRFEDPFEIKKIVHEKSPERTNPVNQYKDLLTRHLITNTRINPSFITSYHDQILKQARDARDTDPYLFEIINNKRKEIDRLELKMKKKGLLRISETPELPNELYVTVLENFIPTIIPDQGILLKTLKELSKLATTNKLYRAFIYEPRFINLFHSRLSPALNSAILTIPENAPEFAHTFINELNKRNADQIVQKNLELPDTIPNKSVFIDVLKKIDDWLKKTPNAKEIIQTPLFEKFLLSKIANDQIVIKRKSRSINLFSHEIQELITHLREKIIKLKKGIKNGTYTTASSITAQGFTKNFAIKLVNLQSNRFTPYPLITYTALVYNFNLASDLIKNDFIIPSTFRFNVTTYTKHFDHIDKILKEAIKKSPDLLNTMQVFHLYPQSLLRHAIINNRVDFARFLLKKGVNYKKNWDRTGQTYLHYVAASGTPEMKEVFKDLPQ